MQDCLVCFGKLSALIRVEFGLGYADEQAAAGPVKGNVDGAGCRNNIMVVRYLKAIWVVTLALLWVPITSHCQLEAISSLTALLACCQHEESTAPHQDKDCEQDACASVESGDYRTQEHKPLLAVPDLVALEIAAVAIELAALPDEVSLGVFSTAPPERHRVWQFAFRTALPVRAPSLAS